MIPKRNPAARVRCAPAGCRSRARLRTRAPFSGPWRRCDAAPNVIEPRKLWPTGGPWEGKIVGMEKGRAIVRGEALGLGPASPTAWNKPTAPWARTSSRRVRDVLSDWRRESLPAIDAVGADAEPRAPAARVGDRRAGRWHRGCPGEGGPVGLTAARPPEPTVAASVRELEQSLSLLGSAPRGVVLLPVDESTRTRWGLTVAAHL